MTIHRQMAALRVAIALTFVFANCHRAMAEARLKKPMRIMIVDQGVDISTVQQDHWHTRPDIDVEAMRRHIVPGGEDTNRSIENLIESNRHADSVFNKRGAITHFEMVANTALSSRFQGFEENTVALPLVDPHFGLIKRLKVRPDFGVNWAENFLKSYFQSMSRIILEEDVRIFVRSMSIRYSAIADICLSMSESVRAAALCEESLGNTYREGLQKLMADNPQTAFIYSAGNHEEIINRHKNKELASQMYRKYELEAFKAPNGLAVAALDSNAFKLASYSERGPEYIRLAMDGRYHDKDTGTSRGTSFAAPRAAVYVRDMIMKDPSLSGAAAIDKALRDYSAVEPLLKNEVRGGRVIYDHPRDRPTGCQFFLMRTYANIKQLAR